MHEPKPFKLNRTDTADHNANSAEVVPPQRFSAHDEVDVGVIRFADEVTSASAADHTFNATDGRSAPRFGITWFAVDGLLVLSAEPAASGARAPMDSVIPARMSWSMGKIGFGRQLGFCALLGMLIAFTGCNGGLAAAVASSSNNSASTNTPSSVSGFTVDDDRQGTATIRFFLIDAEGDSATVELAFQLPGGMSQSLTTLVGATNPALFVGSANGTQHTLEWNYAAEVVLPSNSSFVADVQVSGYLPGVSTSTEGVNSETRGLGNDAPVVLAVDTSLGQNGDVDGVVPVQFTLADSSEDAVNVVVEFLRENEQNPPGQGWQFATPATLTAAPPEAFVDLATSTAAAGGVGVIFFWDTDIDLFQGDEPVRIRFTPRDGVAMGLPVETGSFQVDNNEEPTISILEGLFQANSDQQGGIPIPYRVADVEGDEVQVVFQWRRPTESFPALPATVVGVQAVLDDPVQRRALQIATEFPTFIGGRVVPVDANSVRLPELATGEAPIRLDRIVGCELQIMRASDVPSAPVWSQNPLVSPVAAIPIGDGMSAYVLDANTPGNWRLREIELATGVVLADLVTGSGAPTALTLSSDERFVFIASFAGIWQVNRFDLTSGVAQSAGSASGIFTSPDGIRGMAALGSTVTLVTVDDTLLRVDFSQAPPTSGAALTGLAEPWGVAIDPLQANHAYLALRTEHRVVDVDLNANSFSDLPAEIFGGTGIPLVNPRAIALERGGARLLVVTQRPGGKVFLRGLNLRASTDLDGDGQANPAIFNLEMDFDPLASMATGGEGLRVLAAPDVSELFVGGGIEQVRTVEAYDPARHEVRVANALQPILGASRRWRIPLSSCPILPGSLTFPWDSRELLSFGGRSDAQLLFRVLTLDSELGGNDETTLLKPITSFVSTFVQLGDSSTTGGPQSVEAADLDGDGDLDLVSANGSSDSLTVFFQSGPGVFDPAPLVLGDSSTTDGPRSVEAADLDGDGDLDLVSANSFSDSLTVFFQLGPGVFDPVPLELGDASTTDAPQSVKAADLDGDGDLDLVSANEASDNLTVFFQSSPGVFEPSPLVLGDSSTTDRPQSVEAADLDGDGDIDLVSANEFGDALTVFFQISPGAFDPSPLVVGTTSSGRSVKAADLDGDGDQDLVLTRGVNDSLTVFFQSGPGVFDRAPLVLQNTGFSFASTSVEAADLDGDGDLDLVSANPTRGNLTVFFQSSPGVFDSSPLVLEDSNTIDTPLSVEVADLDGDGSLDFVFANFISDTLKIFFRKDSSVFDPTPLVLADGGNSVETADLDGDGDLDLVYSNGGPRLEVLFQNGPGVFNPTSLGVGSLSASPGLVSVDAADLDGDGDQDLVSANLANNTLAVFFQSSPGVFDPSPLVLGNSSSMNSPVSVIAADLDGDGDQDLVSANQSSNTLTVFFQSGPGVFDPSPLVLGDLSTTNGARSVKAADLDGDGDLDLVCANERGDTLSVFFQNGPGVFGPSPLVLGGKGITDAPFSVEAADLDGDGDQDLVSVNLFGDNLTVFFQIGPGVFDLAPLVLGDPVFQFASTSVEAADLDGDGDLDLVSANFNGSNLAVFRQSSPGVFDRTPLVLGGGSAVNSVFPVEAADLDGDGDVDLVSGHLGTTFAVFWNRD